MKIIALSVFMVVSATGNVLLSQNGTAPQKPASTPSTTATSAIHRTPSGPQGAKVSPSVKPTAPAPLHETVESGTAPVLIKAAPKASKAK